MCVDMPYQLAASDECEPAKASVGAKVTGKVSSRGTHGGSRRRIGVGGAAVDVAVDDGAVGLHLVRQRRRHGAAQPRVARLDRPVLTPAG